MSLRRNWNEPGGTQLVDVEKKKKKRDSVVNGNIPNFYCQMLSAGQSSESTRILFYFSFSVRPAGGNIIIIIIILILFFCFRGSLKWVAATPLFFTV